MSLAFGLDGRLIIEKTENKGENCSLLGRKSLQLLHISKKLNIWCNVKGTDTAQPSHLEITSAHLCK